MCDLELLLQSKIVNAKTNFENNLIESRVSSSVFSYIHSVSNPSTMPTTLHLRGKQSLSQLWNVNMHILAVFYF